MTAKLLQFSKDPLDMNGPEAIAYLDVLAADVHNKLLAFGEQIEVARVAGNTAEVERLSACIAEFKAYQEPITRHREGVYQDFRDDFLS
jgi:hypothetical protein